MLVLESKLILVVVVAVDGYLLLVPVDHHSASGPEAAGQDAVVMDDAADVGIWKQNLNMMRRQLDEQITAVGFILKKLKLH